MILDIQELGLTRVECQFRMAKPSHLLAGNHKGHIRQVWQGARGKENMAVLYYQLKETIHECRNDREIIQEMKIINDQKEIFYDLVIDLVCQGNEKRFGILLNGFQAIQLRARGFSDTRKLF